MADLQTTSYNDIPLGICIIKRDRKALNVLFANDVFLHILGIANFKDIDQKPFKDIWPHHEADELAQSLKTPTPPRNYNLPLLIDDDGSAEEGVKKWTRLVIREDEWDGDPCYKIWVHDISLNKAQQEDLENAVVAADATAEMKSNFLATMSHEIRTPMQTIFGLLELIDEEKPTDRIQNMVSTARDSACSLLEILDDILDIAKMDADKMELDVFEVPVRMLVRGTLEALEVKVHGSKVKIIDDITSDVPFVVIGDPKRLRQIIMNLAGNALKFTREGTVTARVSTDIQHLDVPKNRIGLRFEIEDTGIGMSKEVCEKLFGAFAQADSSTSREFGGTGLGLNISKKLTDLMGGEIGVESEEGVGSTFWFEIPTEEVSTETTSVELPDLTGISVLSIEDHPQGAKEIMSSLQSMGATVEHCGTCAEGRELIKRRPFDVGIFDQGLPDGLGLDLLREAADIRPNMGLVMYTARADTGLSLALQSLGVTYITKPASRPGLGEAVLGAAAAMESMSIDGPTRLLIAEDTASVRDVLGRQLQTLGVDADFVENGLEALEALKSGKYGILFTDLHMPEMDGYGVVEAVRATEKDDDAKHFPVIVLTADVQMAHRDTYMKHGFDECLLKPVSLGQFRRLLIRWGLLDAEFQLDHSDDKKAPTQEMEESDLPPAIDRDSIMSQMGALDANTVEMMHMFVDMTTPLVKQIEESFDHGDLTKLQEGAHSMKGAARSACCNVLGDIASELQDQSEAGVMRDDLVEAVIKEFERVKAEVSNLKPD